MPPDPDHPFDPEDITYFFDNWCSLPFPLHGIYTRYRKTIPYD